MNTFILTQLSACLLQLTNCRFIQICNTPLKPTWYEFILFINASQHKIGDRDMFHWSNTLNPSDLWMQEVSALSVHLSPYRSITLGRDHICLHSVITYFFSNILFLRFDSQWSSLWIFRMKISHVEIKVWCSQLFHTVKRVVLCVHII